MLPNQCEPTLPRPEGRPQTNGVWLLFLGLACLVSLTFTTDLNGFAGRVLAQHFPSLVTWFPQTCIASTCGAFLLYLTTRPWLLSRPPLSREDWRRVGKVAFAWLFFWYAGSVAYALLRGGWTPYVHSLAAAIGFVLIAPLGEELLFRGLIFRLAERTFPQRPYFAVTISTVFFSLHHLQLHYFELTGAALTQMAFTLPMGIVFAQIRQRTGRIWPAYLLHVLTNLPHAFG